MLGVAAKRVWSRDAGEAAAARVRAWHLASIDSLSASVRRLAAARGQAELARAFADARDRYKRVEAVVAFSFPGSATGLNGPALERIEEGDPTAVVHPEGFQLVEQLIFADQARDTARLRTELAVLVADVTRLRALAPTLSYSPSLVFSAAREELARVAIRGLAEADSPIAHRGQAEADAAVDGVIALLAPYAALPSRVGDVTLASTIALSHRVDSLRRARHVELAPSSGPLWRKSAASLFDHDAFDADAFAPRENRAPSSARVDLGRLLFFDSTLSRGGTRTCASCHQPEHAFADPRAASPSITGAPLARNAPSLINVALQPALFHDMRTARLEDQAREVIENPAEMGGNLDTIVSRLSQSEEYLRRFVEAFPPAPRPIDRDRLQLALAAYMRSLVALNAPLDRYLRGDRSALSLSERRGLALFTGKARCASCHALPLTSGAVPPSYVEMEGEGLGVPSRDGRRLDPDAGIAARSRFLGDSVHFRTPSLRNVALTAPYMHNGTFRTLAEVIDFYDRGGGAGRGFRTTFQTLATDTLGLTRDEKRDLIALLGALTDTVGLTARPRR